MSNSFRKFWFFVWLWLICLSVFTASDKPFRISAQSTAAVEARVTSVTGNATVSGNGRSGARLTRGAVLAPGHEIDTRGGGRVVVDLSDGSQVVVLPGSRLVIGDYRTAGSLRELLQITLGRIRVKINNFKNKPNPYRIKSPTASIAVRGTEFEVTVEPLGETRVVVLEGLVEVASLNDSNNSLLAEPGRGVIVRPDFTLDFFVSGFNTKKGEKNSSQNDSSASNANNVGANSQAAANVYERFVETVVQNGETALPSRFTAFPDAHLDSLDNPAYAGAFTAPEGQLYFLSSLSDADADEPNSANPVDYGTALQGTFFAPLKRFRAVVGASGSFVNKGLQSFNGGRENPLSVSPILAGIPNFSFELGTTNNKFFDGSLIVARRFGSRDQTNIGLSYEQLTSNGNLNANVNDASDPSGSEFTSSSFRLNRRRLTFGAKHDFGDARLGLFYRYEKNSGGSSSGTGSFNNPFSEINSVESKGNSSEIGLRLRGAISPRLFYGAEGTLLFGQSRENLRISETTDSMQRSATNRASLGFGLGYVWRPRTIFSFDVAGGLLKTERQRRESFTGNLLENNDRRAHYLSLHAAAQTDVWRSLFAGASILSLTQSSTAEAALFPDRFGRKLNAAGVFSPDGRRRNSSADFYSNYGIGWRFTPNFIFQYTYTTDYGRSAPRHAFLFRYTFDFSGK